MPCTRYTRFNVYAASSLEKDFSKLLTWPFVRETVYSIVPPYTRDPRNVVNTCQYRQEALDESRGTCTNNIAVNIYMPNGKGFAIPTMLNYSIRYVLCCMVLYGWIDTSDISNFSYFN